MEISIRRLEKKEIPAALELIRRVFDEYEAPDYSKDGISEFYNSIGDAEWVSGLCFTGAFVGDILAGVMATRSEGSHIALLFADGKYHRKGIGRRLFQTALESTLTERVTVNSSPYGTEFYHRLGFCDTDTEQSVNGMRFTPMEYKKQS